MPPYQLKAEFFRPLGHPTASGRWRAAGEELVPGVGLEVSDLFQQLGVAMGRISTGHPCYPGACGTAPKTLHRPGSPTIAGAGPSSLPPIM